MRTWKPGKHGRNIIYHLWGLAISLIPFAKALTTAPISFWQRPSCAKWLFGQVFKPRSTQGGTTLYGIVFRGPGTKTGHSHPAIWRMGTDMCILCNSVQLVGPCQPWQHWPEHHDSSWMWRLSQCTGIQQNDFQDGFSGWGFSRICASRWSSTYPIPDDQYTSILIFTDSDSQYIYELSFWMIRFMVIHV